MFFRMSQGQKCKGIQRVKISMDVCNKPLNSCWVCPQYENINVLLIFLELEGLHTFGNTECFPNGKHQPRRSWKCFYYNCVCCLMGLIYRYDENTHITCVFLF